VEVNMKDVANMVVSLMAASARTAPKAGGKDFLEIVTITEEDKLGRIADTMKEYATKSTNEAFWLRDASNIENSQALLLIGLNKPVTAGYDCGGCGYPSCSDFASLHYEDDGHRCSPFFCCQDCQHPEH
jgi:uncharacterized ferredoxin-like protein